MSSVYKSIKVEKSVYDKLSKAGSLGTTYSEVIDSALDVYLKQGVRREMSAYASTRLTKTKGFPWYGTPKGKPIV